jgi:RNA polymerase sigma factor (sigma-70 family)
MVRPHEPPDGQHSPDRLGALEPEQVAAFRAFGRLRTVADRASAAPASRSHLNPSARRAAIADGLAALSEDHREALRLRIVEERSYAEVAQTLGVSEQTARARVSRALRTLSKTTEHLEGSPDYV